MKLDDFLKVKQVRCVVGYGGHLTTGKTYPVLGLSVPNNLVQVENDNGFITEYDFGRFEPVLGSAENPLQNIELTPEFEAAETVLADNSVNTQDNSVNIQDTPKFKVGDPVYWGLKSKIFKVYRLMTTNVLEVELDGCVTAVHKDELCPATLENYGKLCSLFECIDFEQPPTQADIDNEAVDKLAQAMKNKLAKKREQGYHGWATCKHGDLVQLLINHVDKGDPIDVANFCAFLFARGEQLTQGGA